MKIALRKHGEILTSRPAGRDAALAIVAYSRLEANERVELDFSGVLSVGPSWLDEVLTTLRAEYGKNRVVCLPSDNASVTAALRVIEESQQ